MNLSNKSLITIKKTSYIIFEREKQKFPFIIYKLSVLLDISFYILIIISHPIIIKNYNAELSFSAYSIMSI
jgi:hypothetical protein